MERKTGGVSTPNTPNHKKAPTNKPQKFRKTKKASLCTEKDWTQSTTLTTVATVFSYYFLRRFSNISYFTVVTVVKV